MKLFSKVSNKLNKNKYDDIGQRAGIELTAVNLKNHIGEHTQVLFTGDADNDVLADSFQKLVEVWSNQTSTTAVRFVLAENINQSPEALALAGECDSAILLVQYNKTSFVELDNMILKFEDMGKEILGFIAV